MKVDRLHYLSTLTFLKYLRSAAFLLFLPSDSDFSRVRNSEGPLQKLAFHFLALRVETRLIEILEILLGKVSLLLLKAYVISSFLSHILILVYVTHSGFRDAV